MYNIYSTRRQYFNLIICYHYNSSKSTCHNLIDFHECQSLSSFFPCNFWVQSYGFHIFANLRTFSRWESKFSLWGFLQSSGPSSNIPPHISCKENVAVNQLHVSNKNSSENKVFKREHCYLLCQNNQENLSLLQWHGRIHLANQSRHWSKEIPLEPVSKRSQAV